MSLVSDMLNKGGASDTRWALKPGLKVGADTVCRTFQPSFVVTREGVLFAFCQGRLKGGRDDDPKVILMSRSDDTGKTWGPARAISAPLTHFAISAYVRPEGASETLSVLTCVGLKGTKDFYNHDYARMADQTGVDINEVGEDAASVLCRFDSMDGGEAWSVTTLTDEATPLGKECQGFTPVFFNPIGQVHVVEKGPYAGRYVIAGPVYAAAEGETLTNHFRNHPCVGSGVIYSNDQGCTWCLDGVIGDYLANECSAVTTGNGEELLMIRRLNPDRMLEIYPPRVSFRPGFEERIAHTSADGGRTWSRPFAVKMSGIRCHGTLARVGERLYFSIPTGIGQDGEWTRRRGAVYYSDDKGRTWASRAVEEGTFSYSTVGRLTDEARIVFFGGGTMGDEGLGYRIFTDEWLEDTR